MKITDKCTFSDCWLQSHKRSLEIPERNLVIICTVWKSRIFDNPASVQSLWARLVGYECCSLYLSNFDSCRLRNVCHLSRQQISLDLWIFHFTSMTDDDSWWADNKIVFLWTCFIIKFMTNMHFFSISRTILLTKALISCLVLNTPDQLGRCLVRQDIFRFTQFECQLCFTYISNSSQLTLK